MFGNLGLIFEIQVSVFEYRQISKTWMFEYLRFFIIQVFAFDHRWKLKSQIYKSWRKRSQPSKTSMFSTWTKNHCSGSRHQHFAFPGFGYKPAKHLLIYEGGTAMHNTARLASSWHQNFDPNPTKALAFVTTAQLCIHFLKIPLFTALHQLKTQYHGFLPHISSHTPSRSSGKSTSSKAWPSIFKTFHSKRLCPRSFWVFALLM